MKNCTSAQHTSHILILKNTQFRKINTKTTKSKMNCTTLCFVTLPVELLSNISLKIMQIFVSLSWCVCQCLFTIKSNTTFRTLTIHLCEMPLTSPPTWRPTTTCTYVKHLKSELRVQVWTAEGVSVTRDGQKQASGRLEGDSAYGEE
jgi:hypothetical protein